tara:strand:- start:1848 stop:2048 length:201 start_codon:yes stop_codon:yes gene_type:complete
MKDVLTKTLNSDLPVHDFMGPEVPAPENVAIKWAATKFKSLNIAILTMALDAPSSSEAVPRKIVKN